MANKKGAGPTSKKVETKKVATINGPTSKQAFKQVEEEQRARLAKQRKAEEEWLQKLIEKEEGRKKRIQHAATDQEIANFMQNINTKEEQKTAQRATADNKSVDDERRNLTKTLEAEQRQTRVEHMKRVKAVHRTQMLDKIIEETECPSPVRQETRSTSDFTNGGVTNGENQEPGKGVKGALIT